ncbi:MAG: aminotransferase class I/II-fold pyridoxal phosphate-dependent enzyme [Planctomycetes bacterium]|nr:aminotransferase class I/II-fold pyridoxal phosphate-dependent enzyme [Planctomycetota bacterium]
MADNISMEGHLADRMAHITSSGIRRIFELGARLVDPIDLSIGQAHFDVPEPIKEAAIEAIRQGRNRYTITQGIGPLNEGIRRRIERMHGFSPESTLVTSGVSGALLLGFECLVNPGDDVLLPDPYFTMYKVLATLCGARLVYYDTYPDFRLDTAQIAALITDRTKLILLNSPSNPTGAVYTRAEIENLAALCRAHDLVVVSDEIYDQFVYDAPFTSIATFYEKTLLISGFTKSYGMPGWRVGYAAGPAQLLDKMKTLQQFTYVCAPSMAQHACLTALDVDVEGHRRDYREKRDMVVQGLDPAYQLTPPAGSFYGFPTVPAGYPDDVTFVERALAENLLIVPGSAFSRRNTHFRLSFAADNDRLERGIEILNRLAHP